MTPMDPVLSRIVKLLSSHPTVPIEAEVEHTGGGIFCVRVDVNRVSDVEHHEGPFLYLTDGADMGEPGTVAVGFFPHWEHDGSWPDGTALRCVAWEDVHATVLEGADLLSRDQDRRRELAVRAELTSALDAFKRATGDLDRLWASGAYTGDEVANYPTFLPSFDEFAASVANMEVR